MPETPSSAARQEAHPAGVCECNAVTWEPVVDETRTIRRYRVWQCRACKRLRHREDPA